MREKGKRSGRKWDGLPLSSMPWVSASGTPKGLWVLPMTWSTLAVWNASGSLPGLGAGLGAGGGVWGHEYPPQPPGLTCCLLYSAGGTGVLLNVDRVAEQLEELGYPAIQVRGLADSGWFLDNKQYRRTDCIDTVTCAPTEAIRRGIRCQTLGCGLGWPAPVLSAWGGGGVGGSRWGRGRGSPDPQHVPRYWNGVVPERCRHQFKDGEEWNCFFGYKVYPTLRCEGPAAVGHTGRRGAGSVGLGFLQPGV